MPRRFLKREVEQVGFPPDKTHICKGWIEASTLTDRSPTKISFCYLDMDFYQSTRGRLAASSRESAEGKEGYFG